MSSLHIARDLLYWPYYIDIYILHVWSGPNRSRDVCYFYKYESNLNNYLDLNVSCTIKVTKYFYLITVMVAGTFPFGQALDTKIARYNSPNYSWNIMFLSHYILKLYYFTKKKNNFILCYFNINLYFEC
jgi:hypothetical protein